MRIELTKIVAITGASSGMGKAAAELFAERGWQVFAGARRWEEIPKRAGITPLFLDVTAHTSNRDFTEKVLTATSGRLDVLINNAGYGEFGPAEEVPMAKVRKQFETNFFGAVELTQLFLPAMRAQKSGRILNISSIGGNIFFPLGAYYHATKAAMNIWSDNLDMEIRDFGLRSILIQPGGTASSWGAVVLENAEENLAENSPYRELSGIITGNFELFQKGGTSEQLAELFWRAATDKRPKFRYYNNLQAHFMGSLGRKHPWLWKFLLLRLKSLMKK